MNKLNKKLVGYDFESLMKKKGYKYFTNGNYNLNIIGIRADNKNKVTNQFDDAIVVIYNVGSAHVVEHFDATTDPGITYMKSPMSKAGCAILVPGQYPSGWRIGFHQGKYQALVQNKPVKVYRDANKDNKYDLDPKTITEGMFGINIHKAGVASTAVNNWSAGCQVFANNSEFNKFMNLCYSQIEHGFGKTFTYTLLNEQDLFA